MMEAHLSIDKRYIITPIQYTVSLDETYDIFLIIFKYRLLGLDRAAASFEYPQSMFKHKFEKSILLIFYIGV